MTSEQRHDPPTDPALPVVEPSAPAPKKRRNISGVLSIAAVAAGIACILGATFGAGVFVGSAGHHRHGAEHHHSAMMFHQRGQGGWDRDRGDSHGWDRDRGHWQRPDQGDRGWQQDPGQGADRGGPGNGGPTATPGRPS